MASTLALSALSPHLRDLDSTRDNSWQLLGTRFFEPIGLPKMTTTAADDQPNLEELITEDDLFCASPGPEKQMKEEEDVTSVEFMPCVIGIQWTGYGYDTVKVIKEGSQAFWSGVKVGWVCTHVLSDNGIQAVDPGVKDHCFNLLHDAQSLSKNYKLIFKLPSKQKESPCPSDTGSFALQYPVSELSNLSSSSAPPHTNTPQPQAGEEIECYDPRADLEALLNCDFETLKRDRSEVQSQATSPSPTSTHNYPPVPNPIRVTDNTDILPLGTVVNVFRDAGAPARAEIINLDPTTGSYVVRYRSGKTWCPVPRESMVVLAKGKTKDPVGTVRAIPSGSPSFSSAHSPRLTPGSASASPRVHEAVSQPGSARSPSPPSTQAQQPELNGEVKHTRLHIQFCPGYRPTLGLVFCYEEYGWVVTKVYDDIQLALVRPGDIVTSIGFRQLAHATRAQQHAAFKESMEEFGCSGSLPITYTRPHTPLREGHQVTNMMQHLRVDGPRNARKKQSMPPIKKFPVNPAGRVFVGGLHPKAREGEVRAYFSQFGQIENIDIPRAIHSEGSHRGFCFISFRDPSVVPHVCQQRGPIRGRTVEVKRVVNGTNRGRKGPGRGKRGPMRRSHPQWSLAEVGNQQEYSQRRHG